MRLMRGYGMFAAERKNPHRLTNNGPNEQHTEPMTNTKTTMAENDEDRDNKWLGRLRFMGWSLVAFLLLLPAVAMQFTIEVVWTASDFIFAAVVLIGTGLTVEVTMRKRRNTDFRTGVAVALAAAFLLTWINAAVGFVGAGANWANILYFLLVPTTLLGSVIARFKAKGMSVSMAGTAMAHALVTVFAFVAGLVRPEEVAAFVAANIFFIETWVVAAVLFHRAARHRTAGNDLRSESNGDLQKRKGQRTLAFIVSSLTITLSLVLMFYMVRVESEPGALPLLLFIIGVTWLFLTLLHRGARL